MFHGEIPTVGFLAFQGVGLMTYYESSSFIVLWLMSQMFQG